MPSPAMNRLEKRRGWSSTAVREAGRRICMFCFVTVRAPEPGFLGEVEAMHRMLCMSRPTARLSDILTTEALAGG